MAFQRQGRQAGPRRLERGQDAVRERAVVRAAHGRAPFLESRPEREHPPHLAREKAEQREERRLAARAFLRGLRRFLLAAVRPEGRERGSREKLPEEAQGLEHVARRDGVHEVRAVLAALVRDLPGGVLGRDPRALGGVDEAVEVRQERSRLQPPVAGQELEHFRLDEDLAVDRALETERVEAVAADVLVRAREVRGAGGLAQQQRARVLRVRRDGMDEEDVVGRRRTPREVEEPVERRRGAFVLDAREAEECRESRRAVGALHAPRDAARRVGGVVGEVGRRNARRGRDRARLARETHEGARVLPRLGGLVEERVELVGREALAAEEIRRLERHEAVRRKERDRRGVRDGLGYASAGGFVGRDLALAEPLAERGRDPAHGFRDDPVVVARDEEEGREGRRSRRRKQRRDLGEGLRALHGAHPTGA